MNREKFMALSADPMLPRYINPWADCERFINLGRYIPPCREGEKVIEFDLYAIENAHSVDLGARYSDEPSEYVSGGVYQDEAITGSIVIVQAAARYYRMKAKL